MVDKKMFFKVSRKVEYSNISNVVYTDASIHGWGHSVKGGSCIKTESKWHINELNGFTYKPQIKTHYFMSQVNCQESWATCKDFFGSHYCHSKR